MNISLKTIKCSDCNRTFKEERDLIKHLITKHKIHKTNPDKPFRCKECFCNFKTEKGLNDHIIRKCSIRSKEWYYKRVRKHTNEHIIELFDNWNGLCFYTGKKLLCDKNDSENPMYRTVDHMIPISYGFKHQIEPELFGNIDNLCLCSQEKNQKKGNKIVIGLEK